MNEQEEKGVNMEENEIDQVSDLLKSVDLLITALIEVANECNIFFFYYMYF